MYCLQGDDALFQNPMWQKRFWSSTLLVNSWFPWCEWSSPIDPLRSPVNGSIWFISTLMPCYILFPLLMKQLQVHTDAELSNAIVRIFWLQIGFAIFALLGEHYVLGYKVHIYLCMCIDRQKHGYPVNNSLSPIGMYSALSDFDR